MQTFSEYLSGHAQVSRSRALAPSVVLKFERAGAWGNFVFLANDEKARRLKKTGMFSRYVCAFDPYHLRSIMQTNAFAFLSTRVAIFHSIVFVASLRHFALVLLAATPCMPLTFIFLRIACSSISISICTLFRSSTHIISNYGVF